MFRDRPTLGFKVCVQGLGFRVLVLGWSGVLFLGGCRSLVRSLALSLSLSPPSSLGVGGRQVCAGDAWATLGFKVCV